MAHPSEIDAETGIYATSTARPDRQPAHTCCAVRGGYIPKDTIMTAVSNKLLMSRFVEFINTANEALATELVAPDAVFHAPVRPDPLIGPRGYMEILGMMRAGFPDIQWTLEEMVAEDDTVAARFTMRGTHQAPFFGVPASGKKIQVQAVNFYRFLNGKIIAERGQPDLFALLQQIGAMPA